MGNVDRAKQLRRTQTDAERVLWFQLRGRRLDGLKFKRQVPIDRFIVDFCCNEARLIVELDDGQHAARTVEDANRTRILEAFGYLVLRFWNSDVLQNTEGVLEEILSAARQHLPLTPTLSPTGRGSAPSFGPRCSSTTELGRSPSKWQTA